MRSIKADFLNFKNCLLYYKTHYFVIFKEFAKKLLRYGNFNTSNSSSNAISLIFKKDVDFYYSTLASLIEIDK